jgi:hypothetical protein
MKYMGVSSEIKDANRQIQLDDCYKPQHLSLLQRPPSRVGYPYYNIHHRYRTSQLKYHFTLVL